MDNEIKVIQYKSNYAIIDRGDGKRCAWCDKLITEFKDVTEHIVIEDTLEKIEKAFDDSEELLYRDFIKLKKELLND